MTLQYLYIMFLTYPTYQLTHSLCYYSSQYLFAIFRYSYYYNDRQICLSYTAKVFEP